MSGKLVIPVAIRPMREADDPIVYDSWLGSMADEMEIVDPDERRRFKRDQKPVIKALLDSGTALVATPRAEDANVLGWVCFATPNTLHFVFVKKPWRRGQIARQLIERAGLPPESRASHFTSWGFPRVERLFKSLTLDPTLGAP